jgi:peroxiredoxin
MVRAMNLAMLAALAAAIAPGTKAPAFSLESSDGKKVSLDDFKGQTLVLAFFPKAFTGG